MANKMPSDYLKDIDKAFDRATRRLVIETQSKLSEGSPVDSGRLASSWFVGTGVPNRSQRSEDWAEPGAARVEVEKPTGPLLHTKDHYVSNNLPYSAIAAYSPGYVGSRGGGSGAWYSEITNQLGTRADKIFDQELRKVK